MPTEINNDYFLTRNGKLDFNKFSRFIYLAPMAEAYELEFGFVNQQKLNPDNIEKVIFNPPATIVFFKDGTKEVVKCSKDDEFDAEMGFAQAMMNIMFGNRSSFKRFIKKYEEE